MEGDLVCGCFYMAISLSDWEPLYAYGVGVFWVLG